MKPHAALVLWLAALTSLLVLLPAATDHLPTTLPHMLSIDWQRVPDLSIGKSGFQNSDGGWVTADEVVVAFGHGHGSSPFLNTAYRLNVTAAVGSACRGSGPDCRNDSIAPHWRQLPDAPVSGRQDVASAVIDGAVYILGGFSYSSPYSYADFLRLGATASGAWEWRRLPSFPYPVSMHAVASIGAKLYVQGGACYDRKSFVNFHDCTGGTPGLGKRLYVFDVRDEQGEWKRLPVTRNLIECATARQRSFVRVAEHTLCGTRGQDNPGPPRANAALSSVNGSLFVMGGMTFAPVKLQQGSRSATAMTLVDNWRYDPHTAQWSRLADLPVASGNFQTNGPMTAFEDRYIVLIGGYQYEQTYYFNGSTGPSLGQPSRMCPQHTAAAQGVGCLPQCAVEMKNVTYMDGHPAGANWSREYNNDVFVYDTRWNRFGRAVGTSQHDPGLILPGCGAFPINDNLPQVNVLNDSIFAVGGECNDRVIAGQSYGHYPPLAAVGKLTALSE